LYPPFEANTASNDFASWNAGTDKKVLTMQVRPGQEVKGSSGKVNFAAKAHEP